MLEKKIRLRNIFNLIVSCSIRDPSPRDFSIMTLVTARQNSWYCLDSKSWIYLSKSEKHSVFLNTIVVNLRPGRLHSLFWGRTKALTSTTKTKILCLHWFWRKKEKVFWTKYWTEDCEQYLSRQYTLNLIETN